MKKLICLFIAALMILSMIPVMAISTSAAVEGMWTTYQGAGSYPELDDEPLEDGEEAIYPPEAGYEYTADGFTVIEPDWSTTLSPFMTVSTKDKQNLKDGVYLKFRVDNYAYGGDIAADHWICITLNTGKLEDGAAEGYEAGTYTGKVSPGSTKYGGGWLTLLRGTGDGNVTSIPHLTDPKTDDFGGTFVPQNAGTATTAELDDEGREINTLEVSWTGSAYEIKINGVAMPDATAMLEKLSPSGDFFVGITMMDSYKAEDSGAGLTILEYGTSASNATKPVGDDSKEPGENGYIDYPIIDASTIEANMPAILWSPETSNLKSGNNVNFTVQGDNTWLGQATAAQVFFSLNPKRKWSYDATDFPVFGIMVKNLWVDSGTLWYAAGEITSANNNYTYPFSIYDGEFFGEDEEYIFVPVDLTDMWEGRINGIRLDFNMADESTREFELCFAGMFRSVEEAYTYANNWLAKGGVETKDPTATEAPTEPDTDAPAEDTTAAPEAGDTTAAPEAGETTAAPDETEAAASGCGSVIGFSAAAILAAAAAAVALKKD